MTSTPDIADEDGDLARRALAQQARGLSLDGRRTIGATRVFKQLAAYGIRPVESRGVIVSNELIDRIRDEEGI
ncbi:MAG: hypothetical protein H7255_03810 [Ramlibacter sp.]|nr:hypothetical protein [Ramlibacter sp.]